MNELLMNATFNAMAWITFCCIIGAAVIYWAKQ